MFPIQNCYNKRISYCAYWKNSHGTQRGMDHIRPGFDYWYSFIGQGDYFNPMVNDNGKEIQKGYITDILTEKAINWLNNKRDPSKPFILNLWHKAVHEKHLLPQDIKNFSKGYHCQNHLITPTKKL